MLKDAAIMSGAGTILDSESFVKNPKADEDGKPATPLQPGCDDLGLQAQGKEATTGCPVNSPVAAAAAAEGNGTEPYHGSTEELGAVAVVCQDSHHASTEELGPGAVACQESCGAMSEADSRDEEVRVHTEDQPESDQGCPEACSGTLDAAGGLKTVESDGGCKKERGEESGTCNVDMVQSVTAGNHAVVVSSNSPENSDRESPPEDELYAMLEVSASTCAAKPLGMPGVESGQNDILEPDACCCDNKQKGEGGPTDVAETASRQSSAREASEGPEVDNDQAPECDREPLVVSWNSSSGCDTSNLNCSISAPSDNNTAPLDTELSVSVASVASLPHIQSFTSELPSSLSPANHEPQSSTALTSVSTSNLTPESYAVGVASDMTLSQAAQISGPPDLVAAQTPRENCEELRGSEDSMRRCGSDQAPNAASSLPPDCVREVLDSTPSSCDRTLPASQDSTPSSCDDRTFPASQGILPQPQRMISPSKDRPTALVGAGDVAKDMLKPLYLEEDSDEEELLTELDAELQLRGHERRKDSQSLVSPVNGMTQQLEPVSNRELCMQFEDQLMQLQETILQQEKEIHKLTDEKARQREVSQDVMKVRDKLKAELTVMKEKNPDDIYLPQIKEMEKMMSQQQIEIQQLKEKLTMHDSAAKRAIASLQSEMKGRIDQVTKLYEDSCKEKDSMVMKFAQAETKNIDMKCTLDKLEARVRDLLKEKEFNTNKMRATVAEKNKAVAELQAKVSEMSAVQKEMEKLKEEHSSLEIKNKWFQNKLKVEQDSHKETKSTVEKITARLREAKEETEIIRKDCQAIVKKYQESEEVRSNSLDKELKLKEAQLMVKMKEKTDTEEIQQKTKRELEALKAQHRDAMAELSTFRDKVQCLEEERMREQEVQSKYESIIQNQKTDNANLTKQLAEQQTLREDFERAQEMIKALDREMSELKLANRDLQKDIEGCQARESKFLALQSELSRSNALLRSDNTTLSNQVATLSGEVQKSKMDIQDLETRCKNLGDQLQEEQTRWRGETDTLSEQLAEKSKQCEEYRQKWEDEVDSSRTWKRKHASNVKDLTRQLQHAKKRLEAYDTGSGERDGASMGSRTNSNGSLNSVDNLSQHNHPGAVSSNHHPARMPSQESEYPVIVEQVEVDKQMLIERIVRLQRSLARKNEKLEFLEEHIQQLVTEIKKKNKLIQGYALREESGTLTSDVMDANKTLLSRKGGIMASVYTQHQQDGSMTLDLSLEINRKLQAVLEDTLLKNMTLKENLDTLGEEIAHLSQENRRLQLHLQGLG